MAKLTKFWWTNSKGERKVNCYNIMIPRDIVEQSSIKDTETVKFSVKDGKIIIEKEVKD